MGHNFQSTDFRRKEIELRVELFVYGTLKRGFANHERFCRGLLNVEDATVRGCLYDLPAGYPALTVPEVDVLTAGTTDPRADAATQKRLGDELCVKEFEASGWNRVHGELLAFDDPATRLPALDALEGFVPEGSSFYRRVLIPARLVGSGRSIPAWAYVVDEPSGVYLPGGRWPGAC